MPAKSPKSLSMIRSRDSPVPSTTKTMVVIMMLFSLFVFIAGLGFLALAWKGRNQDAGNGIGGDSPKVIVVSTNGGKAEPPVYPVRSPDYPLRNAPQDYQQMGVLVDPSGKEGGDPTILALFGRKMQTRDRWEYYAASDKFHMWKLPVQVQKRVCDHEFGCDEIYNGDQVIVPDYGNRVFTARIYAYAPPGGGSYL